MDELIAFYRDFPDDIREILAFEKEKLLIPEKRYCFAAKKIFHKASPVL